MIRTLLLVAALCLTGCSAAPAVAAPPAATETGMPTSPPLPELRLHLAALNIDQPLQPLDRDVTGRLLPPPVTEPGTAGWYVNGVAPGDTGPALIAGHVSGRPPGATHSVPGVFFLLATVRPGDTVHVDRDRRELTFKVYRVGTFDKVEFPTADVYGDTPGPELRLITCGGVFGPGAHSYASNVVVWARLVTP